MKDINILYDIVNLNAKEYMIAWSKVTWTTIIFDILGRNKKCVCPKCWSKTDKRQDLSLHVWKIPLKHIRLSDERELQILPHRRYFRCSKCRCSFLEKFNFEAEEWLHTKAFDEYVKFARGHMSGQQIARNTRCSWFKIHKILKTIDSKMIEKKWMEYMQNAKEIYLWIDEHSFHGRDMVLVICDIKEKRLIAVLPDNRQETLRRWLHDIPITIQKKILWVSTDMHKTYLQTVKSVIPYVLSTIDKYHLIQEANRMVDDVRQLNKWLLKMNFAKVDDIIKTGKVPRAKGKKQKKIKEMKKYKEKIETLDEKLFTQEDTINMRWEQAVFKEITYDYFINSGCTYKTLLWKREKNLSWIQKLRLRQIFREFDYSWYVWESWNLKERFSDALEDKDFEEVVKVMEEALSSEHYRIQWFWKTLRRWKTELKNYCLYATKEFWFTNAPTESINNQCKVAKRVSHGFRHKENYMRKLASRFVIERKKHPKNS